MSVTVELVGGRGDGRFYALPALLERYRLVITAGVNEPGPAIAELTYALERDADGQPRLSADGRHVYRFESEREWTP